MRKFQPLKAPAESITHNLGARRDAEEQKAGGSNPTNLLGLYFVKT
jgi:hypothetical protein